MVKMGKASRWMINFLLGKKDKEKNHKKKNNSFNEENDLKTPNASLLSTPKRRWSFGKSSNKEKVHRSSTSFDSFTPLIAQHASSPLEWEIQQSKKTRRMPAAETPTESIKGLLADRIISKSVEYAAATRLQAAFRSYLARKALHALRGLVKLQALVRGHLVRKQTTATLRRMHALMAIQIRARFQRIQMADESSQLAVRSQSSRHGDFSHDNELREVYKESIKLDIYETKGHLKDKHGYFDIGQRERTRPKKYYSSELYISNREKQYDDEFSFPTAPSTPHVYSPTSKAIPGRASFTYQKPDYLQPISHPNYMAYTESSRAKVRSQSEPKQRPKLSIKPKSMQTASMDGRNGQQDDQFQGSTTHSTPMAYENEDPWFIKLYQSTISKDRNHDPKSPGSSSYSNYSKLLVTYEPHLNMY